MRSILKVALPPKLLKVTFTLGGVLLFVLLIVLALQVAGGYMLRAMDGTSTDGLAVFAGAVLLGAASGGIVSGFPLNGIKWVGWSAGLILLTSALFLAYSLWSQPQFSVLMAILAWLRVLSWTILSLVPSSVLGILILRWTGIPLDEP